MQEIILKTKDGIKTAVNYYNNGKEKAIIIAPGWFMTKDSKYFKEISEVFAENFDVITIDFRGHGKSSGFYTFTRKEENDLNTVTDFAKNRYKTVYGAGFSLGAAVLINVAAERPGDISKIIAVSAPSCFEKIENNIWKKEAWLMTVQKYEPARWFSIRPSLPFGKKTRPIDTVDKLKCPALFIAGDKDPTVSPKHTKALYDKAVCKKRYELFENCCHAEDLFIQDRKKFVRVCTDWLINE